MRYEASNFRFPFFDTELGSGLDFGLPRDVSVALGGHELPTICSKLVQHRSNFVFLFLVTFEATLKSKPPTQIGPIYRHSRNSSCCFFCLNTSRPFFHLWSPFYPQDDWLLAFVGCGAHWARLGTSDWAASQCRGGVGRGNKAGSA